MSNSWMTPIDATAGGTFGDPGPGGFGGAVLKAAGGGAATATVTDANGMMLAYLNANAANAAAETTPASPVRFTGPLTVVVTGTPTKFTIFQA